MIDPILTPGAFRRLFASKIQESDPGIETLGYTPALTFLAVAEIFCRQIDHLEPFNPEMPLTPQVIQLQNYLLASMLPGLTMKDLTRECQERVNEFSERFDSLFRYVESEEIRSYFRSAAARALEFRADVLDGGGVVEDLLTAREKLVDWLAYLCPAYSVGTTIYGGIRSRENETIGVDQANVQARRDVSRAIAFGNGPCHLSEKAAGERVCPLPPIGRTRTAVKTHSTNMPSRVRTTHPPIDSPSP
jgi:hypothetical protein